MSMSIKLTHKIIIPEIKIVAQMEKINNTCLTFGVNKTRDKQHALRDDLATTPIHKSFYGDTKPIGNAQLLKRQENGFTTQINFDGKERLMIVPPRPVLKPIFTDYVLSQPNTITTLKRGIRKDLRLHSNNGDGTKNAMLRIKGVLNQPDVVKGFIRERGRGYWNEGSEYNGELVDMVKFYEFMNPVMYQGQTMSQMLETSKNNDVGRFYPLEDSGDMIKSIRAQVGGNGN